MENNNINAALEFLKKNGIRENATITINVHTFANDLAKILVKYAHMHQSVEPIAEWKPLSKISELKRGEIVRHKSGDKSYIVESCYGDTVTAVSIVNISKPNEWEVLSR